MFSHPEDQDHVEFLPFFNQHQLEYIPLAPVTAELVSGETLPSTGQLCTVCLTLLCFNLIYDHVQIKLLFFFYVKL